MLKQFVCKRLHAWRANLQNFSFSAIVPALPARDSTDPTASIGGGKGNGSNFRLRSSIMRNALNSLEKMRVEAANCKSIGRGVNDPVMKQLFDELAVELDGLANLIERGLVDRAPAGKA